MEKTKEEWELWNYELQQKVARIGIKVGVDFDSYKDLPDPVNAMIDAINDAVSIPRLARYLSAYQASKFTELD